MTITIKKLAEELKIKPFKIMQILRKKGDIANSSLKKLDKETANRIRKIFREKVDENINQNKKEECPNCETEISINARVCKHCWLKREKFEEFIDLKKEYYEDTKDYIIKGYLSKIYRNLRKEPHIKLKKEIINQYPAYCPESIQLNEELFKKRGIKDIEEITVFLAEYYLKKNKYEKNMLPILWEYSEINFEKLFKKSELSDKTWDEFFLNFSNIDEFLDDITDRIINESSKVKKEKFEKAMNTVLCIIKEKPDSKFKEIYSFFKSDELIFKFENTFLLDNHEKKKQIESMIKNVKLRINNEVKDFEYLTRFNEDNECIDFLHTPLKRKNIIKIDKDIKITIAATGNTGKSSLINTLMKNELAEVKNFPGVWKYKKEDKEKKHNHYETGIGITFIDTPGFGSIVEEGKKHEETALSEIENSDICYAVFDSKAGYKEEDRKIYKKIISRNNRVLFLFNKIDECRIDEKEKALNHINKEIKEKVFPVSAITCEGLSEVIKETINNIENEDLRKKLIFYLNKHWHKKSLIKKLKKIAISMTTLMFTGNDINKKCDNFDYVENLYLQAICYECLKYILIPKEMKRSFFEKYSEITTKKITQIEFEDDFKRLCFGLGASFTLVEEYLPYIEEEFRRLNIKKSGSELDEYDKILNELEERIDTRIIRYEKMLKPVEIRIIKNIIKPKQEIDDVIMTLLHYIRI